MSVAQSLPLQPLGRSKLRSIFTPQFTTLMVVALILVVVEGLTRGKSIAFAGQGDDSEVLSFGPYFAWITLPFTLLYARSVHIRISEALLLWLLLGSVVYDKSFAYTRIPGIPVYVTDIVLAICCIDLWRIRSIRFHAISKLEWVLFGLFFAAGCLAASRGFLGGQDKTKTLRDFAIVLYTVFVLVSVSTFRSWVAIRRYLVFGAFAAILATINAFFWFLTEPYMRRYIQAPVYVQAVFVAAVFLKVRGWKGWKSNFLVGCSAMGLLLGNARSTDLVAFLAIALLIMVARFLWKGASLALLRFVAIVVLSAALLIGVIVGTGIGQKFIDRTARDVVSGIHFEDDGNAIFRFLAWAEAYRRFSQNPAFGEGYGIPFIFELADNDPRPHNTYLTVAYKMGLFGFIPLAAILFEYYRRSFKWLYQFKKYPRSTWLLVLILVQFSFCAYGALNLLLESPFLASLFWINIGMTISVVMLLRQESRDRPSPVNIVP